MDQVKGAVIEEAVPLNGTLNVAPSIDDRQEADSSPRSLLLPWCGIGLVALVGCFGFFRELALLWGVWTDDPLRSIGIFIPPVSIVLTLRAWKQNGWERRGSWWGLALIGLAFATSILRQHALAVGNIGSMSVPLTPKTVPLFFYWAGMIVLFAGWRVARRAWFPLLLMLLAQPVPGPVPGLVDIPLQKVSAQVARAFASLIGFAPTTPELRLMFAPDFGMFIAPGCDGMRGAVTMGYLALILGYLKRVSVRRWILYVSAAVLLGYIFNFVRLCLLVVYYRIALGHTWLEHVAKQADYAIGSCLFLIATLIFVWAALRKEDKSAAAVLEFALPRKPSSTRNLVWKGAAFAALAVVAISLQAQDIRGYLESGGRPSQTPELMPSHVGDFKQSRVWYERSGGIPVIEDAAYSAPGSGEVMMGIWVAGHDFMHNSQDCWSVRGLDAQARKATTLTTVRGQAAFFDTGFYSDGITDSIVATALCTPASCTAYQNSPNSSFIGFHFALWSTRHSFMSREHPVSFIVRIDTPHTNVPQAVVYESLNAELQRFVAGLDLTQLSRTFQ
jgi:exosortase J